MHALVTTAPSGDPREAAELAARFGLAAEERGDRLVPDLLSAAAGAPVIILGSRRADLYLGTEVHRASAGMAFLRVLRARKGELDPLVRAAGLREGDRVLDCTLGLGGDALVAAHAVGQGGSVVGLEIDPVLAAFTAAGLCRLRPPVGEIAARIEVRLADHRTELPRLPAKSHDVVLFDPMFRAPLGAGPLFSLLRSRAHHEPLRREDVEAALRVARRGVLIKDAWPGRELHRLGVPPLPARRAPKVVFGWAAAG